MLAQSAGFCPQLRGRRAQYRPAKEPVLGACEPVTPAGMP